MTKKILGILGLGLIIIISCVTLGYFAYEFFITGRRAYADYETVIFAFTGVVLFLTGVSIWWRENPPTLWWR